MMKIRNVDCVIVGAGPAGLSAAYYLKQYKVEFMLLDSGGVASSWEGMNDSLHLVSPWWTNRLPGTKLNFFYSFKKHSRLSYIKYLHSYHRSKGLGQVLKEKVVSVNPGSSGYLVTTSEGVISCKALVCASGYYGNPYVPDFCTDGSVDIIHASEYKNVERLLENGVRKVLVVGRRVTAGQLAEELFNGGISVALSTRGAVNVKNNDTLIGVVREQMYFFWEWIRLKFQPDLRANSYPEMDGGRIKNYLNSGDIPVYGSVIRIESKNVFLQGSETPIGVDAIYLATGYQPNLDYLSNVGLNSTDESKLYDREVPIENLRGIYFLGFDNLFNFTSRYLRGIRLDSKRVAKKVAQYLSF